jgi:mannose-6-phosphate isomerase-like protein (cupin superfamily)
VARAGDVIELAQLGERFIVRRSSAETNGEVLEVEQIFRPGSLRGIASWSHIHERQSERHEVLAGNLGMTVDGRKLRLSPGDAVTVPAGSPHRLFAVDGGEIRLLLEIRPVLKTEIAFETLGRLASEGRLNRFGTPPFLQLAVLAHEYRQENRIAWLPHRVQAPVLRVLAAVGRRRGYRARLTEHGPAS